MSFYLLLLQLAGAVTLLLWAVRMVRTGVERAHEPALRRALRGSGSGLVKAAGMGTVIAILLQSSTAVAILAAGFAGQGILSVSTGLALMLGADLGSSLVVQVLSFNLSGLIPVLLIAGGVLFFKSRSRNLRQTGRILMGIALILVSLGMISSATQPLRDSEVLPMIIGYLKGDFVTAFLLAAAFTWLAHSSIASVLLIATFAAEGIVPLELGISFVLGANLGGGLIAAALTRSMVVEARRIAIGNLMFRGIVSIVILFSLHLLKLPLDSLGGDVARQLINLHLAFNLLLVVLCLPLVRFVEKLVSRFISDPVNGDSGLLPVEAASALDYGVINSPRLALASATREIMRMAEVIE
ncbi:Sodium-dependent phosphate transporter, partial [hydrothermal vent metagenome]